MIEVVLSDANLRTIRYWERAKMQRCKPHESERESEASMTASIPLLKLLARYL
jgi:hypothetical protein